MSRYEGNNGNKYEAHVGRQNSLPCQWERPGTTCKHRPQGGRLPGWLEFSDPIRGCPVVYPGWHGCSNPLDPAAMKYSEQGNYLHVYCEDGKLYTTVTSKVICNINNQTKAVALYTWITCYLTITNSDFGTDVQHG